MARAAGALAVGEPRALPRPPAVARVLERVRAAARVHRMFEPGDRVLVAVSGGPDSLCLLHALARLRRLLRVDLACFHFDHGLREGSETDARYVARQARALGVPFVLRRAESRPGRGESVEAWAREVRYRALAEAASELGARVAAVGHTADDQAETVLLALLRGGGAEALSGMAPVSRLERLSGAERSWRSGPGGGAAEAALTLVRPLLEVTREETEAFCRALRLRPRRDPMNEDPSLMRAAVRRRVVPLLEEALGRKVRPALVRTAALLRSDAEFLEALATEAAARVVREQGRERLLDTERLRALPRPLASRVVRAAILALGVVPDAAHVEAVLDLAAGRPGRRAQLPGGLLARRGRGYVSLSRPSPGSVE
ncbi:MAG TPA: tRNA lysidine(34) synthetase TilS [Actinomycetota bacterium]|nr:tRNA lysidine(34) synthetase TilS [Actinomycetota bacterium]